MYKVLLVDDEKWALSGVKNTFPWESEGFKVVKETTYPAEALEFILNVKPQVVFTDIRMPGISGIELMKKVREKGLDTEFIVISGFSEFAYAQQALQQGAFDYCLKPLQMEYANELLKKLRKRLDAKRRSRSLELFEMIMENKCDIKETLKDCGLKCRHTYYQALVLESHDNNNSTEISGLFQGTDHVKVDLGRNKTLYIFNTDYDMIRLLKPEAAADTSIGISSMADSPDKISRLYMEADLAACSFFIYDEYRVSEYQKRDMVTVNRLIEALRSAVDRNDSGKFKSIMENMHEEFKLKGLGMEDVLYFWNQMVAYITKNHTYLCTADAFDFMEYEQVINRFGSFKSLCEYLGRELLHLMGKKCERYYSNDSSNEEFNKLLQHIHKHYTEQIFLRDLAKQFYINESYCCYLFKRHLDSTFSDYINKLRMEKSRELLENSSLSIDEIAETVGYNDYFYFNKVFKKYHGITAAQYRKSIMK